MLYTFAPPLHISHYCNSINLHSSHHHLHLHLRSSHRKICSLPTTDKQHHQNQDFEKHHDSTFYNRFYDSSSINQHNPPTQYETKQDLDRNSGESSSGILSNMWWADLKAAIGQRFNMAGILFSVSVIVRNKHWMIPHVSVPDVRYIDWVALKKMGFEGVVFDKDNTLTIPYSLGLWGPVAESVECCKSVFGDKVAVFSNSAGLQEYDPDGRKARAVEFAIGIRVIRHKMKKPAGSAEEVERHFGCDSSKLVMVGDRPFTDIVYGNRNGFLTILTAPLSLAEETFIVKQVRKIELAFLNWWLKKGLKPANARLLRDALDCVRESPFV
ncbi:hypothetical protein QVD17_32190 [Tagetes erecta]|uniref:Uncharacterized protein n=1 Tax=Tagetes erecta TaxID=13708 RepID=A0AAD8K5T4_TARER|nr:hypothetical protein QVD17_32190 [Tagetes erecta]